MESELFSLYSAQLQQYEKYFKNEAIALFESIEIHKNQEGFDWDRLGLKDEDKNFHLHKNVEEIFSDLIDFAVVLSFIPQEKRKNRNLLRLLFVIKFSKSKQSQVSEQVQNFLQKFIQDGSFTPSIDEDFLLTICSSIPINIILSDYLSILMDLQSSSAQFEIIKPIYQDAISKQVKAGVILQFLNNTLDLYQLFQRTQKEKKDILQIYQKRQFDSFFSTNYGKLGLTIYLGELYLHPSIISQTNLVIELFGKIPFITQCFVQNGRAMLYLVLPDDKLPMFKDYLERLQHVNLITHFFILSLKAYESNISLYRKQNKRSYLNSFLPFSGRYWIIFNRPLQKMSNLIDKHYRQKIDYTPSFIDFLLSPFHLLLLIGKSEIFQNLYRFSNMQGFLSNAKKKLSSKVKLLELPPVIQNIAKFSETYDFFVECGFFNQYADFSSAINSLEKTQESPTGGSLPTKSLKLSKNIINSADLCKYPSPATLENYSSREFLNEITQISGLRKNQQISKDKIEKMINQLFSSQILLENRGNQITQFFNADQRFFMVQFRTKNRLDWLERILFANFVSIFESTEEKVYNYQILLSTEYWRVFIRFLTLTPLDWVKSLPTSPIPTPTHELLFFFNYSKQKWDRKKYSLVKNCDLIPSIVKKYLPLNKQSIPFNIGHDEKIEALFPPFSLYKFMQGVFILRKDIEIARNLMKESSHYFEFLQNTFLIPSFDMDSCKSFLRENFNLESTQIQRIMTTIPKQRHELHPDLELGRYLLIIHDYPFPCHPRVLSNDRLLSRLFCSGLQHVFFLGGTKEGVLVLEYLFPKSLVSSSEFKLQKILNRVEEKYLLQLKLLNVTDEFRFRSTSLDIKQYQHLTLEKALQHISYLSFVHIPQIPSNLLGSIDIPDAFWQVVGHPVTLFIHINCSESMKIPLVNMLMQLPIGQILVSEGDSKPFDVELIAMIHLAEAVNFALYQLSTILDKEEVRYFISPIIDYSIINDPNLNINSL